MNYNRFFYASMAACIIFLMMFSPDVLAQSTSAIEDGAQWVLDLLTGNLARIVAIIAVVALGYLMLVGRMDIMRAVWIIIGIVVIFGAATIVDSIRGS